MTEHEELIERIEAAIPEIGSLPINEKWLYGAVRHCRRNMCLDEDWGVFEKDGSPPDRQSGTAIAQIVNMLPEILAALKSEKSA